MYSCMNTCIRVLFKVFARNQSLCLRIQVRQIEKIFSLVGEHLENVPEYIDLLCAIVKVEGQDTPLRRNQVHVMKNFMSYFNKIAVVLEESMELRYTPRLTQIYFLLETFYLSSIFVPN